MNTVQLQALMKQNKIAMPLPYGDSTLVPDYFCCSSCIGGALVEMLTGTDYRGAVWFSEQWQPEEGDLYLSWGVPTGDTTPDFGREIVAILDAAGVPVQWDGDTAKCLRLLGINGQDFNRWYASTHDDDDDLYEWYDSQENEWLGEGAA